MDSHKPGLNKKAVSQKALIERFNQWTMTKGPKSNPLPKISADDLIKTEWYLQVSSDFADVKKHLSEQDLQIKELTNTLNKNNESLKKEKKAADVKAKKNEAVIESLKRKLDSQPDTPKNESQFQRMIQTSEKKILASIDSRLVSFKSSVSEKLEDVKP